APAIADGHIYVCSPYAKALFAYDVDTGKKLWEFNSRTKIKGAPAIADNRIYFGDTEGNLYQLAADSGRLIHQLKFSAALAPAGPVVINHNLYISCQDGNVYSIPLGTLAP